MKRHKVPSYCRHKATNQAYVRLHGKCVWLGVFDSPQSHKRYAEVLGDWQAERDRPKLKPLVISQLCLLYLQHCDKHYRKNGKLTTEAGVIRIPLRHLNRLYRKEQAVEFSPLMLKRVRESMIPASYVRTSINRHVGRIVRMFRWAASEQLIPVHVWQGLKTVDGLRHGRSKAKESNPVRPVPVDHISAIEPYLSAPIWAMVRLQLLTGMRPAVSLGLGTVRQPSLGRVR